LAPVIVQQIGRLISEIRERGFAMHRVEQNLRFALLRARHGHEAFAGPHTGRDDPRRSATTSPPYFFFACVGSAGRSCNAASADWAAAAFGFSCLGFFCSRPLRF
jgi:hypothetical protein